MPSRLIVLVLCVLAGAPALAGDDDAVAGEPAPASTPTPVPHSPVVPDVIPGLDGPSDQTNPTNPTAPPPLEGVGIGLQSTSEMIMPFVKTMLMLCVVLLLVWLTLSKGMGKLVEKAQAGKRVKVIERVSLDARRSLFLVEIDGKHVVIGGGDVVRIADLDELPKKAADRQTVFEKVMSGVGRGPKAAVDETEQPPAATETT